MKAYYVIDGYNDTYRTLNDVRFHVSMYAGRNRANMEGELVYRVKNGESDERFARFIRTGRKGRVVLARK